MPITCVPVLKVPLPATVIGRGGAKIELAGKRQRSAGKGYPAAAQIAVRGDFKHAPLNPYPS